MEDTKKKNGRGGARAGAGRKPMGRDIAVTFKLSADAKRGIEAYAKRLGISQQEAVNRLFKSLLSDL